MPVNRNDLTPALAARPWDEKRGLPVPLMNMRPKNEADFGALPADTSIDWVPDFTAIYAPTVLDCADKRTCGICGGPLGYRFAFIGGPKSTANRTYADPPFCLPCAEWAMRLCPHMLIQQHKRAPEHRFTAATDTPTGFDETKPDDLFIGVTRDFTTLLQPRSLTFKTAPFTQIRRFTYVDGTLTEADAR